MGFLSSIIGAAAPIVGGIFGGPIGSAIGGAVGGLVGGSGSKQAGTTTATQQQQMDPRMQAMLYGGNGSSGLLNQISQQANAPVHNGTAQFGLDMNNYLSNWGGQNFLGSQGAAQNLQASNLQAPQMQAAQAQAAQGQGVVPSQAAQSQGVLSGAVQPARAAQINAPGQNNLNLADSFNNVISGNAAENPYLTGAIQKGINQSTNAFQNLQSDATKNLTENVLPRLRSGSIMSGAFGGSRQGLAEGKAVSSFSDQMGRALSQVGQNNTDAAVSAQAGAFNQGQDRSLSAMSNLNSNQFGTAAQNAGFQQQTGLQNASQAQQNNQFNAGNQQQNNQFNANNQQQTGQFNTGLAQQTMLANLGNNQQTNLANAGFQQGANQNNQQAQQSTNALNSANQATGIGLSSGLLNQAYGYGQQANNADLNRLGQVSSLLAPYSGMNSTQTSSQPYYTNPAGNILGGATSALGLYNQFAGLGGNNAQDTRNGAFSSGDFLKNLTGSFNQPGAMQNFNVSPGTLPVSGNLSSIFNFGG